jgi:outer membrane protein assembly factor BamD
MKFVKNLTCVCLLSAMALCGWAQLQWSAETGWVCASAWESGFKNHDEAMMALAIMNEARSDQEKGDTGSALDLYKKIVKNYSGTPFAPEAIFQRGKIYEQKHQYTDASECYTKVIQEYPGYPSYDQVMHRQYAMAEELMKGARPYYFGFIPGLRSPDEAITYFETVVRNDPYGKDNYAPMALMNIALISEKEGKKEDAIDALERLVDKYPKSILAPDAYQRLGNVWADLVQGPEYDQGATLESIKYYEDFLILFPDHEDVTIVQAKLAKMRGILAESKKDIGDFYYKRRNNAEAALRFYGEAKTVDPDSAVAKSAQVEIDKINAGVPPPGTPVDFLFGGKYKEPTIKESMEDSEVLDGVVLDRGVFGEISESESFMPDTPGELMASQEVNAEGETPFHEIIETITDTEIPTTGEMPNSQTQEIHANEASEHEALTKAKKEGFEGDPNPPAAYVP